MLEQYLPECQFRGREHRKIRFAVLRPRPRRAVSSPDLLDEPIWWQSDDFWFYALAAAVAVIRDCAGRAGETLPFWRAGNEHAELIEAILLDLAAEREAAYQNYHGEQARELIAWLHLAGHRYPRYVETARRLGSSAWMPIVALAESALAAGDQPLAVAVFRTADQPGAHCD